MWRHLLEIYEESRLNVGRPECLFAETLIFNEGRLLRSALKAWKAWKENSRSSRLPFLPFPVDAVVYSEGQLRTPFKARSRGDPQAESHTRVDGIAGYFSIADGTKSGIELAPDCRYICVFEAKLYSPIAKGITHAPEYDQVSRTTACLIHALLQAGSREGFEAHVVVLYPEDNLDVEPEEYEKVRLRQRIGKRLAEYKGTGEPTLEIRRFAPERSAGEDGWEEMFGRIDVHFKTWEQVLTQMGDEGLNRFYDLCKQFGR